MDIEDVIQIVDLEVRYRVGVPEAERASAQRLLLSVALYFDVGPAATADDLDRTINYSEVARGLAAFGDHREWRLIEKLAVDIAQWLLEEFSPARVSVEVKKFVIPQARYVSVRVVRSGAS